MKKREKVAIGTILMVTLLISMVFVLVVSSLEDLHEEADSNITTRYANITIHRTDNVIIGEIGARATYNIDGGWLKIDESASNVCTGNAQAHRLIGVPNSGATCKITINFTYIDTSDITGGYVIFRLTLPDGSRDEEKIYDRWGREDGTTGILTRTFTVFPNNNYVFTIYCERSGNDGDCFTDSANIFTIST